MKKKKNIMAVMIKKMIKNNYIYSITSCSGKLVMYVDCMINPPN